ncbi:hypothetical protein N7G274_008487 [Stereocaulon virgatum]|uniref:Uncharacterized protein n=1 Tax=Stereocaulon virgatum TaxID=373712 RepID=A0ABR3ZYG9_9LECA
MRAGLNEAERKQLKRELVNAVEQFKDIQTTLTYVTLHDMQHELLTQQKQIAIQLQSLLNKQQKLDEPLVAEHLDQQEDKAEERNPSSARLNELDEQQNTERLLATGHLYQQHRI